MGYYINHRSASLSLDRPGPSDPDLARWRHALQSGNAQERRSAMRRLVESSAEDILVQVLACTDPAAVSMAVEGLWECWLNEAGPMARLEIEQGIEALQAADLDKASKVFSQLMDLYPSWAEAINKLATVLYLQGKPEASIELCRQVVALKPDHFGAWNGLALCAVQTEDWPLALRAVRESLRLQPQSPTNRQLLHLIESRLP